MEKEPWKEIFIKGERFLLNMEIGILKFHIREPFYSAGKQFKWFGASIGLGISRDALVFALQNDLKEIHVTVGNSERVYGISTHEWLNFANHSNSKIMIGSTEIYVCQWSKSYFKRIE